jgi:hypothetical protein
MHHCVKIRGRRRQPCRSRPRCCKWVIAFSVILCALLEVLDSSIVNVALPHMQGSFSASVDEVTWVVTTYLVAAGIMIPATGYKTKPRPSLPAFERGHKPHADCSHARPVQVQA